MTDIKPYLKNLIMPLILLSIFIVAMVFLYILFGGAEGGNVLNNIAHGIANVFSGAE